MIPVKCPNCGKVMQIQPGHLLVGCGTCGWTICGMPNPIKEKVLAYFNGYREGNDRGRAEGLRIALEIHLN